jgi:RNA polymerase primary sigma factor
VEMRTALQPVISLEASLGEGTSELGEMIPDLSAEDPGEASAHSDARRRLAEALAALPEREQIVLSKRLGFDGDPQSLTTIGKAFGVSRERVQQLESTALKELWEHRKELRLEGLAA